MCACHFQRKVIITIIIHGNNNARVNTTVSAVTTVSWRLFFSKVELFFSQILIDKIINWRYLFLFTCMQCFNEVATHGALWMVYKIITQLQMATHTITTCKYVSTMNLMEHFLKLFMYVVVWQRVEFTILFVRVYTNTRYNCAMYLDSFLRFYHMKFKNCSWNEMEMEMK